MIFSQKIDTKLVKEQLEKIILSSQFKKSPILSNFLSYIVTKAINGKSNELKEFVIATDVLKKTQEFDPQLTALVRIHAKRLRDALGDYYLKNGLNDKIRISIPKGRYIPLFEMIGNNLEIKIIPPAIPSSNPSDNPSSKTSEIHPKPYIGIFQFKNIGDDEKCKTFCTVLCQNLSIALTHYQEFIVIAEEATTESVKIKGNIEDTSKHLQLDYILTGSYFCTKEHIKLNVELILVKGMQQLWAESFTLENNKTKLPEIYDPVIKKILCMVGGYFGLIYRNLLSLSPGNTYPENSYVFVIYWGHHYSSRFTSESFRESFDALNPAQKKYPDFYLLSAVIASIHLNSYLAGVEIENDSLNKGMLYAKNAATMNPMCQYSFLMLALASILNKNLIEFKRVVKEIYRIHPFDPIHSVSIGFGYICLGEYETGFQMQMEAINNSPFYIWCTCLGFCFHYIKNNNYQEALHWSDKINRPGMVWDPLIRTSILGLLGKKEQAAKALEELCQVFPTIETKAPTIIDRLLTDSDLQSKILVGLSLAGLKLKS